MASKAEVTADMVSIPSNSPGDWRIRSRPPMTVPRVCGHSPLLSMNTSSLCISILVSKLYATSQSLVGTATIPSCPAHTCKIAHGSMAKALNGRMLDS